MDDRHEHDLYLLVWVKERSSTCGVNEVICILHYSKTF